MSPSGNSVTIGVGARDPKLRGTMDSGAGKSVIDMGTFETLGSDMISPGTNRYKG